MNSSRKVTDRGPGGAFDGLFWFTWVGWLA